MPPNTVSMTQGLVRWTSVDPLAEKFAGISPYNYVFNNPLMLVYPDGQAPVVYRSERWNGDVVYRFYETGGGEDLICSVYGFIPVFGWVRDIVYAIDNDRTIITANVRRETAKSIVQKSTDILQYVDKLKYVGQISKHLGLILNSAETIESLSFKNNHINEILKQKLGIYMNSSTKEGVIEKYMLGYSMIQILIDEGKLDYETNFWKMITKINVDSKYIREIRSTFMRIDALDVKEGKEDFDKFIKRHRGVEGLQETIEELNIK